MIKPTVGRIVLVHRFATDLTPLGDQPEPAIVTYVHNDFLINATIFSANGHPHSATNLPLIYDDLNQDAFVAGDTYAEWMLYQKEQQALADSAVAAAEVPVEVAIAAEKKHSK